MVTLYNCQIKLEDLYKAYSRLETEFGWTKDLVFSHGKENYPVYAYSTPETGSALWVLGGIHGEEPAGPNAFAQEIETIAKMADICPMVFIPLCNPLGLSKDWRYPNEYRDWHKGLSVGDPTTVEGKQLAAYLLNMAKLYPPLVLLDHHEDEALPESYIYSMGRNGIKDPIATKIIQILATTVSIQEQGITRFGETVINGIIGPVPDGSIDEFVTQPPISAQTVITIETPAKDLPLETRVAAHVAIIREFPAIVQAALRLANSE